MADLIPYMVPTQFQDSIFPPITHTSTPPPPFPISQATTLQYTVRTVKSPMHENHMHHYFE
jgi:hypothetical protein